MEGGFDFDPGFDGGMDFGSADFGSEADFSAFDSVETMPEIDDLPPFEEPPPDFSSFDESNFSVSTNDDWGSLETEPFVEPTSSLDSLPNNGTIEIEDNSVFELMVEEAPLPDNGLADTDAAIKPEAYLTGLEQEPTSEDALLIEDGITPEEMGLQPDGSSAPIEAEDTSYDVNLSESELAPTTELTTETPDSIETLSEDEYGLTEGSDLEVVEPNAELKPNLSTEEDGIYGEIEPQSEETDLAPSPTTELSETEDGLPEMQPLETELAEEPVEVEIPEAPDDSIVSIDSDAQGETVLGLEEGSFEDALPTQELPPATETPGMLEELPSDDSLYGSETSLDESSISPLVPEFPTDRSSDLTNAVPLPAEETSFDIEPLVPEEPTELVSLDQNFQGDATLLPESTSENQGYLLEHPNVLDLNISDDAVLPAEDMIDAPIEETTPLDYQPEPIDEAVPTQVVPAETVVEENTDSNALVLPDSIEEGKDSQLDTPEEALPDEEPIVEEAPPKNDPVLDLDDMDRNEKGAYLENKHEEYLKNNPDVSYIHKHDNVNTPGFDNVYFDESTGNLVISEEKNWGSSDKPANVSEISAWDLNDQGQDKYEKNISHLREDIENDTSLTEAMKDGLLEAIDKNHIEREVVLGPNARISPEKIDEYQVNRVIQLDAKDASIFRILK